MKKNIFTVDEILCRKKSFSIEFLSSLWRKKPPTDRLNFNV